MKERPILFSGPMVRAILDGRKTMTRRIVRWPDWVEDRDSAAPHLREYGALAYFVDGVPRKTMTCPYGQPGDRLWVRETWAPHADDTHDYTPEYHSASIYYDADGALWDTDDWDAGRGWHVPEGDPHVNGWRPSIHMPRWASRIALEVTGVRVERLQDISEDDAEAEGGLAGYHTPHNPERGPTGGVMQVRRFATLWDTINADRAPWASNPWVWVVSFRRTPAGEGG